MRRRLWWVETGTRTTVIVRVIAPPARNGSIHDGGWARRGQVPIHQVRWNAPSVRRCRQSAWTASGPGGARLDERRGVRRAGPGDSAPVGGDRVDACAQRALDATGVERIAAGQSRRPQPAEQRFGRRDERSAQVVIRGAGRRRGGGRAGHGRR